jgi:hypothetical protein
MGTDLYSLAVNKKAAVTPPRFLYLLSVLLFALLVCERAGRFTCRLAGRLALAAACFFFIVLKAAAYDSFYMFHAVTSIIFADLSEKII